MKRLRIPAGMYSDDDGTLSVRIAREAVDAHTTRRAMSPFAVPPRFEEKAGVFVTLNLHPGDELRGCIGYPTPLYPLYKALVKSAEGACEDPRFPTLRAEELGRVTVEVNLLTPPELIEVRRPKDYLRAVQIGSDGLEIRYATARGVFLPSVPVEQRWNAETYLEELCMKAGLTPDTWLDPDARIYRFRSTVFREVEPRGPIVRRTLGAEHAGR